MIPGFLLVRIARACCSAARCEQVIEPAIADFQHDVRSTVGRARLRKLVSGYAAFWATCAASAVRDVVAPDSLRFLARAAAVFVATVGVSLALEWLLIGENSVMRSSSAVVFRIPYLGWYARFQSATLMFVVPVASFPALRYARRRGMPAAGVTGFGTVAVALMLALCASGWVVPALERAKTARMYREFAERTHGRYYMTPLDVVIDRSSTGKDLPDLIRATLAPPAHRFPGYPAYVAPEDRGAREACRRDLRFRALLLLIAALAGTLGLRPFPILSRTY